MLRCLNNEVIAHMSGVDGYTEVLSIVHISGVDGYTEVLLCTFLVWKDILRYYCVHFWWIC